VKPAKFEFARARSLGEAATILRQASGTAKVIAGGQSLGPMLNLRLVRPSVLLDITGIPELTHVEEDADGVIIGACVTTSDVEDRRTRVDGLPILASVAAASPIARCATGAPSGAVFVMPIRRAIGCRCCVRWRRNAS